MLLELPAAGRAEGSKQGVSSWQERCLLVSFLVNSLWHGVIWIVSFYSVPQNGLDFTVRKKLVYGI